MVDSISAIPGVGLSLFILSTKTIPGSPFLHAALTRRLNTVFASIFLTISFEVGSIKSYSSPFSTASINFSVIPTDKLKLVISSLFSLQFMKSIISGWSILKIPIFAPLLFPPCLITSVAALYTVKKEIGPDATPFVDLTTEFLGLSLENENPVPPPLL